MVDRVIATAGKEHGGTERMIVLQLVVYCLLFTVMVGYSLVEMRTAIGMVAGVL